MMVYMTVGEALEALGGQWIGHEESLNKRITSVEIDSRKVINGTAFVALPGERVDGHSFIAQVLDAGAACAISEQKLGEEVQDYILVENTAKALRDLAEYYRNKLNIKIVGITGSVGKTSTKEMIASVLNEEYCVQKTAGNFNNEIGLPLTIFSIGEGHEVGVVEMGISDFGEMSRLARIARPDIMVITNIGQCHLENLGTRDGIFKAKTECFEHLNDNSFVVLNAADDKLNAVDSVRGKKPLFFLDEGEDFSPIDTSDKIISVYASCVESLGLEGSRFVLHLWNGDKYTDISVIVPVAGSHMVTNACAAATVGLLLGMAPDKIAAGIGNVQAVAGRGRLIQTEKFLLVDDTYNANPVSMRAELDLLRLTPGRRVAILGDMYELGEDENKLHYELGEYAVSCCDNLICIGAMSKYMYDGACNAARATDSCIQVSYYEDKDSFIKDSQNILKQGDTILIKASHGMQFTMLLDELEKE